MKTHKWPQTILLALITSAALSHFEVAAEENTQPGRYDFESLRGGFVAEPRAGRSIDPSC